jgi:hypothetical protein
MIRLVSPRTCYRNGLSQETRIVRYAEFRDQLEGALREEGLFFHGADRRVETFDLDNGVRHWKVHVHRTTPANAEPFHVFAAIEFDWSPVDAARAHTCEEDLLTELLGRRTRVPRTERRWTRVDLSFHATLPYGSTTAIPETQVFGGWTATVVEKADATFTHVEEKGGRVVAVLGGHGDLEMQAQCGADGLVSLSAVAISAFRMVRVPRVWDNPERRAAEADSRRELGRLARTFKTALDDWTESMCALATWIRYSPPPPGAKPTEPWFGDEADEDDDGGPETTH